MFDYPLYWFATLPPSGLVSVLLVVLAVGWLAGFAGYTRARSDAYRAFVAAQQRVGGVRPYVWPESSP